MQFWRLANEISLAHVCREYSALVLKRFESPPGANCWRCSVYSLQRTASHKKQPSSEPSPIRSGAAVANASDSDERGNRPARERHHGQRRPVYRSRHPHRATTVRAEASGFKARRAQRHRAAGRRPRPHRLPAAVVGSPQEKVTVEANTIAVQSDTGEVSDVITGQQISQLSTNGRSMYSLTLTPGASSGRATSRFRLPWVAMPA